MSTHRKWAAAILAISVVYALSWWVVSTDARPTMAEPALTALSRIQFMLSLPLRVVATVIFGGIYMRHAHEVILGIAFLTPLFWLMGVRAVNTVQRARKRSSAVSERLPFRPDRRLFLATATLGVLGTTGGAVGADAMLLAPQRVRVRSYTHRVPWLPGGAETLRIAHVSDTHLGQFVSRRFLEGVMTQVNELSPDLVFLTGDYVHRHPSFIGDAIGILEMLRPRIGSMAVLGNHDHWEGADACRDAFARVGIPLLDNERVFLSDRGLGKEAPQTGGICIAGVGDLWEDAVDFGLALREVPEDMHRLVLSHNPDTALMTRDERVDLMISGHTHGGQVLLPVIGAPFVPSRHGDRFLGGECEGDGFPVIVSRGLGLAGVPVRFGVPPELGLITLTRA